ncbi:MAG TPA: sodium-dependent transporter, partial [Pseudobdellovibrionaceae bacterium]|nr:sodium-dependent transporter [Pseudobdellovibrionaceae bacterium]
MKEPRGALATRSGFYFLAFSSALGLGNLWRFPYIVGENGGGAFILLYVTLIFFLGAPLVIAELVVGKSAGRSLLASSIGFTNGLPIKSTRSGSLVGWLSFGMCLIVMSYYSIISGWSLYFFWKFILLNLRIEDVPYDVTKTKWLESNLQQIFWVGVHLLILGRIVVNGVSGSIERWINRLTPLLMILVLILMWNAVSLRTLEDVLRYVFYPDFTKLSWSSLTHAVGHVFFTLSIGLGVMVTYGSYINNEIQIPIVSIRIAVIDMILSFMSALLIVPLAMSASGIWVKDPVLIFEVLPRMFMQNAGGLLYGLLFFACISIAGINGMMGFYSTIVASLMDRLRIGSRLKATWM